MTHSVWTSAAQLLTLPMIVACSAEAGAPEDCVLHHVCEITDAACQSAIWQGTACVRGDSQGTMPEIRTRTVDQVVEELVASLDPELVESTKHWERALSLIGLAAISDDPTEANLVAQVQALAAYYDPSQERVTIIDRGTVIDPVEEMFVLSHEFVHALQDQEFGLIEFQERTIHSTDSQVAATALVEGEAIVLSTAFLARVNGRDPARLDWRMFEERLLFATFSEIEDSAAPLATAVLNLPYFIGLSTIGESWRTDGQPGIDALYEEPPHSARFWSAFGLAAGTDPITCFPSDPPLGFSAFDSDSLGMAGAFAYLMASGGGSTIGWTVSHLLMDDSIVLFVSDADPQKVALAWRMRFFDEYQAEEFLYEAQEMWPNLRITRFENDLLFQVTSDPVVLYLWATSGCGTAADLPRKRFGGNSSALRRWFLGRSRR